VVAGPSAENDDLVVPQIPPEADELGGVPGDPGYLLMSLLEPGRGVDADGPAGMAYGVPPRCPTSSSGTSTASRPSYAASAATWRVWLD
jgi:hypothetical protein